MEHEGSHLAWRLTGLDCADCAAKLERGLASLSGVYSARVNFAASTLAVDYDPVLMDEQAIRGRVEALGYGVVEDGSKAGLEPVQSTSRLLPVGGRTVVVAACLVVAAFVLERLAGDASIGPVPVSAASVALYAAAIVVGGAQIARRAVAAIRLKTLDMNVLMTAAVIGAALIGEWAEGASVVVLFALGNALEARTLERTRRGLAELVTLAPATATVRRDGVEAEVPLEDVSVGDTVVVKPGERVATDGCVIEGASSVQEAPITGEPLPVAKEPGDDVYAGSLNESGHLVFEATRTAEDNTLARITHLIEEAQAQRAPIEQTVERFSRYYTPAVLVLAALIALVPPLLGQPLTDSIHRALVMLVIACPCALVISTPVSIVSALSAATRSGVLIKGGRYLEGLAHVKAVAFDKTGTLTTGHPVLESIIPIGETSENQALSLAAAVERRAHHPVARAIVALADERGIPDAGAISFESVTGQGATAEIDARQVMVGSVAYISQHACDLSEQAQQIKSIEETGKTTIAVAEEGVCLALLVVADELRPEAAAALAELHSSGIDRTVMLTGDAATSARHVASGVPLDHVFADLMPEHKVLAVEQLQDSYGPAAMVGDGVNDAPALAVASVGIAMGAAGSDTALETADVALLGDDLMSLPFLIRLSRATVARIRENVALSILIKVVFLALAITGHATMWMAVFADMGTSLIVTANGMRLLAARSTHRPPREPGT